MCACITCICLRVYLLVCISKDSVISNSSGGSQATITNTYLLMTMMVLTSHVSNNPLLIRCRYASVRKTDCSYLCVILESLFLDLHLYVSMFVKIGFHI